MNFCRIASSGRRRFLIAVAAVVPPELLFSSMHLESSSWYSLTV